MPPHNNNSSSETSEPPLPHKKRKTSFSVATTTTTISDSTSGVENNEGTGVVEEPLQQQQQEDSSSAKSAPQSAECEPTTTTLSVSSSCSVTPVVRQGGGKNAICPSRLPSKKRKGSHDSGEGSSSQPPPIPTQQQQQQKQQSKTQISTAPLNGQQPQNKTETSSKIEEVPDHSNETTTTNAEAEASETLEKPSNDDATTIAPPPDSATTCTPASDGAKLPQHLLSSSNADTLGDPPEEEPPQPPSFPSPAPLDHVMSRRKGSQDSSTVSTHSQASVNALTSLLLQGDGGTQESTSSSLGGGPPGGSVGTPADDEAIGVVSLPPLRTRAFSVASIGEAMILPHSTASSHALPCWEDDDDDDNPPAEDSMKPPPTMTTNATTVTTTTTTLSSRGAMLNREEDRLKSADASLSGRNSLLGETAQDASTSQENFKPKAVDGTSVSEDRGIRDLGDDGSTETFGSAGQRALWEAIRLTTAATTTAGGSSSQGTSNVYGRERFESFSSAGLLLGRERFESFGGSACLEAAATGIYNRRDRLESWGGMSDLSLPMGNGLDSSVARSFHLPSIAPGIHLEIEDGDATIPEIEISTRPRAASAASAIPSRINFERDRLNSIASLSEASATGFPVMVEGVDITIDIQAFVSATVASMGDQLAEIAGAVELASGVAQSDGLSMRRDPDDEDNEKDKTNCDNDMENPSEASSLASPMIGATSDGRGAARKESSSRVRSWSLGSGLLSLDYEALAVAVDAANAAAGAFDLASIGKSDWSTAGEPLASSSHSTGSQKRKRAPTFDASVASSTGRRSRRSLPLQKKPRTHSDDSFQRPPRKFSVSEKEEEQIRERARAAVAKTTNSGPLTQRDQHPNQTPNNKRKNGKPRKVDTKPLKKREKRKSLEPDKTKSSIQPGGGTQKQSNRKAADIGGIPEAAVAVPSHVGSTSDKSKNQSSQKWDMMYDCLLQFIDQRRADETVGLPDEEKDMWIWDGNVPTNFKSPDGKALGRWVNNQRTAKTKGTLKEDRCRRLEDAGLKWSVMTSNCWNDTLEHLRAYVEEQTKDGTPWNGNVPTSYQIKVKPDDNFAGEDRNLGRWVNRQRSLYQAGKLRKDRQLALEQLGLRWSMLDSTSWDAMFDLLCKYVEEKKSELGEWDGNVPASYKTADGKALGRWINRQRSSHVKKKLKQEHVDKLSGIGLKWSVHERSDKAIKKERDVHDSQNGKENELEPVTSMAS